MGRRCLLVHCVGGYISNSADGKVAQLVIQAGAFRRGSSQALDRMKRFASIALIAVGIVLVIGGVLGVLAAISIMNRENK